MHEFEDCQAFRRLAWHLDSVLLVRLENGVHLLLNHLIQKQYKAVTNSVEL